MEQNLIYNFFMYVLTFLLFFVISDRILVFAAFNTVQVCYYYF